MAVIKVNGRVIEVPKVLLAYASENFFLREFRGEQIGGLDVQNSGLEERLHGLEITDKSVVGFHQREGGLGRFDVDVLFPGIHAFDDNEIYSFAYLIRGKPVLRKEDGSDFVVDVDPYYNVSIETLQLYDALRRKFELSEDKVKVYDRDERFVGLVAREKLSPITGVEGKDIADVKNCRVTPWGRFLEDHFDMRYALTGDISLSSGIKPVPSGFVVVGKEILLDLDYATKVLGLNFKERVLAEPRTIITAPHPDVKRDEARGGEINTSTMVVPSVDSGPKVVVDPEFRDTVEGAYDIHGVPKLAGEVEAQIISEGAEEPSGVEIPLDAEFELPVGLDAMRDLEESGGAKIAVITGQQVIDVGIVDTRDQNRVVTGELVPLEKRVGDEVYELLGSNRYFEALDEARHNLPNMVYDVVKSGVDHFVMTRDYGNAVEIAKRSSDLDLLKYACMSVCDDAIANKNYIAVITHANMLDDPEYFNTIKKDVLERLSWDGNYAGAADILVLLGDREGALSKLEEGRVYDRAIRLAEELGDSEKVSLLRKRARFLGDFRLSLENELNIDYKVLSGITNDVWKGLGNFARSVGSVLFSSYNSIGSSARSGLADTTSKVRKFSGSTDWGKVRRPAILLALGLAVGYGGYQFLTSPSQNKYEKESWESANELRKKGDLNGALIYARRAQNAMSWYERFFYGIPGIDSDYERFANKVLDEKRKVLAEKDMLVDYPVSTDDREWLHGVLASGPVVSVQPVQPKRVSKKVNVSGLEGVTRKLGVYFGLSFREGDPYTSSFESEVRKQYENYINQYGGINSGSFRFVYVVNDGTISKAVLVRDGDGDALKFGKSLLSSVKGKKVSAHDGIYASNLYKFGGK